MPDRHDKRLARPDGVGSAFQVIVPAAAVRETPEPAGRLATQALFGEMVDVYRREGGFGLAQLRRDRYVGWIAMEQLSAPSLPATHKVLALRTYGFIDAVPKAEPRMVLSLGARVAATGRREAQWVECSEAGWVHERHLAPLGSYETDPAGIAARYLGAPYLWGGRGSIGLDCTGLTQQAFEACGVLLPRDSDMQAVWAGKEIDQGDAAQRGDLVFWQGHVGILTAPDRLLHANAYYFETVEEPLADAVARMGPPTQVKRVAPGPDLRPDWLSI